MRRLLRYASPPHLKSGGRVTAPVICATWRATARSWAAVTPQKIPPQLHHHRRSCYRNRSVASAAGRAGGWDVPASALASAIAAGLRASRLTDISTRTRTSRLRTRRSLSTVAGIFAPTCSGASVMGMKPGYPRTHRRSRVKRKLQKQILGPAGSVCPKRSRAPPGLAQPGHWSAIIAPTQGQAEEDKRRPPFLTKVKPFQLDPSIRQPENRLPSVHVKPNQK